MIPETIFGPPSLPGVIPDYITWSNHLTELGRAPKLKKKIIQRIEMKTGQGSIENGQKRKSYLDSEAMWTKRNQMRNILSDVLVLS